MSLDTIELQTGPNPKACIVVLHGLGADGNDFVPIAQQLQLAALGDVRFVFPHAPTMPVTINGGMVMRAWYDIVGADLAKREDERGLRKSMAQVEALLEREREGGIAAERTVLMGFSQGSALALLTGLRHAKLLAGLVGLSGYLPLAASTAQQRHSANATTPVFLGHGQHDGVVPIERAAAARELLASLGHPVDWHAYPIQHSVSMEEIADLNRWLLKVLA